MVGMGWPVSSDKLIESTLSKNNFWDQANQKVEIRQLFTHVTIHYGFKFLEIKGVYIEKKSYTPMRLTCYNNMKS